MAGINLISAVAAATSLLILASIFGITEGRSVPVSMDGNLHRKMAETVVVGPLMESMPPAFHGTPVAASDVEVQGGDFRPTTPGHSPGAGHSLAPASHEDTKIH